MRAAILPLVFANLVMPVPAWAQDRPWEEQWAHHAGWWPVAILAVSVFLLVLLGWALLNLAPVILAIVAAVLGIRWLRKASEGAPSDPAVSVLRERYARGEIGKEEFDAKLRDLGGRR